MRTLLTGTVSSLALALLLAASASAASMPSASGPKQTVSNLALQNQLERDGGSSDSRLQESPLGQVLTLGRAAQSSTGLGTSASAEEERVRSSRDD